MSRHLDFIKKELEEYGEIHLAIPKSDFPDCVILAEEKQASIRYHDATETTVKVVLESKNRIQSA